MKRFFVHLLVSTFLIVVISTILNATVYQSFDKTPAAGNILLKEKCDELAGSDYNLIALGSSKIFRQFDAQLFSDKCKERGIKAFNMGVDGTYPPETYYALQHILSINTNVKYILLEVRAFDAEEYANWHSIRSYYWFNDSRLNDYLRLENEQKLPFWRKAFATTGGIIALLDQNLNLGKGQFCLNQDRLGFPPPESFKNNQGFVPIVSNEDELPIDSEAYNNMEKISNDAFNEHFANLAYYHLNYLNRLKEMAAKKNVKLIFVMPDNQKAWMYTQLIPIFNHLQDNEKIVISSAQKFPQLYLIANKANLTHLNLKGSEFYTTCMASEFLRITK